MSDTFKIEDKMATALFQVQDNLKQVRNSLENITISQKAQTLDLEDLDVAIAKAQSIIKKQTDDYLETVNNQLLVLPIIEDLQKKKQIPKWKPALESLPNVHQQRKDFPGISPGEKHKSALNMRLLCNPAHPHNRAIMQQKFGILPPFVHKRTTNVAKRHRIITGSVLNLPTIVPKGQHSLAIPEEPSPHLYSGQKLIDLPDTSLLCMSIPLKATTLHHREDSYSSKTGLLALESRCHKHLKQATDPGSNASPFFTTKTPPPSSNSKSKDDRPVIQETNCLCPKTPQNLPVQVNINKYPFTIVKGRINVVATDFCQFKQSFSLCWSRVLDALETLEKLLRYFAVPLATVNGERLVEFSHRWDNGWRKTSPVIGLLSVLENWEEVKCLVLRPGQRYKGDGGIEAAAICIQSCWRRYLARAAYLGHCRHKWAAGTIATSWLMHTQMRNVRKALKDRRLRQLENYRSRAQHLAANWKHIQSSKRTIIHIPSLGYSQSQMNSMKFDVQQNIHMSRLCDIRDENVEVIYVCPRHPGEDILHYYTSLLKCDGASAKNYTGTTQASSNSGRRFIILTPEAVDYFPTHNMCLSTLLKYSPRTLKRITYLIQGKQAYIVGRVAHVDDLAVADELGLPILAPEPAIAQIYSNKSGGRRIFAGAEVDLPPGQVDIYSLNQLYETLARLMTENTDVQRWLFKIDSEHGSRGTAYCDVCHLTCYNWALQERHRCGPELWSTELIQESVMLRYLEEIPQWLACYAQPSKKSCYPNWASFLKTFLKQGGVVEACPPSDSVICLTVDLLLEPGGEVTMLSSGDQLHGSCQMEAIGSTVPQTSVHPQTLKSICMRVGRACLHCHIVGYISLDLATFLNPNTREQKVWAIDLDVTYSDQLAMTQMLLMMTGGTLNSHTSCLQVPMPLREKCYQHKITAKPPVENRYAVISSHLFHSNLSMLYHHVFLMMCKVYGMGFDMKSKQGTVFALYDSSERCSIGMITVSEGLQGALMTFARNLSVIHQEISPSKMHGETNFKELIRNIEDVMQMTRQDRMLLR